MQFRIRVPVLFGLLIVACHSPAAAQINSGYYRPGDSLPVVEPYYNPGGFRTGSYRDPEPAWLGQATFDVLLFDRSDADAQTIVTQDPGGAPLLNTTDLGFPVAAGFRFNLVLTGYDGCDFVFNYLGAKFDNSRVYGATTSTYNFFEFDNLSPAINPDPAAVPVTQVQTSYMSTLNSVEFNSRTRRWGRFVPLAGIRYIHQGDEFDRFSGDMSGLLTSTHANNDLWGFQIGGEALLWESDLVQLQSVVKGGVFYNTLELNTDGNAINLYDPVTNALVRTVDPTASFTSDNVSFFGEVNLELAYQICPQVSIRAGYTVMWLDGVALAPDQNDNFVLESGIGSFDLGTVIYHGSYVGVELAW